jgi:hypothetical protein
VSEEVSRPEFEMLKAMVTANADRLNQIDDHGTRGVSAVQIQVTNLVKEITELKGDVNSRFDAHQKVHDQDERERTSARRWLIGTVIASVIAMVTVITLLVDVVRHLHGA